MSQSPTFLSISSPGLLNEWLFETIEPWLQGRVLEMGSTPESISIVFAQKGRHIHLSSPEKIIRDNLRAAYDGVEAIRLVHAIDFHHPDFERVYSVEERIFSTILALNPMENGAFDPMVTRNACYFLPAGGRLILLAPTHTALYDGEHQGFEEVKEYNRKFTRQLFTDSMQILMARYFSHENGFIYDQSGISVLAVAIKK
jgi:hypothetical protein